MAGIVVNGEQRPLEGVPLHTNALDFLRACGLTGAKEGCAEGECGACSVLVARPAADGTDATEWTAINSCLVPAASLDGQEVVTAEGLGAPDDLHPVQHEMAVRGGSQCGYCTPGFVCSMAAEFYRAGRSATNGSGPDGPRRVPRRQRLRPPRAERQPVPVHRLPADHGRGVRPRLPDRRRPARLAPYGDPAGRRTDAAARRRGPVHPAHRSPAGTEDPRRGTRRHRRRRQHRLGCRREPQGRPGRPRRRRRPARRAARLDGRATPRSGSARPSPSARSSGGWTAGCRCWPRCSPSSPRG